MAKDIPMKTSLSEDDICNFKRFQKMYGSSEAQLLRRAWFAFEDSHWDELSRYEERRGRPIAVSKMDRNGTF